MYQTPENIDYIITGCKNADRKSQELLYRGFYHSMMNLCLRYTKNEPDAMSVLNQGFLKVFQHINKYDASRATLYTWIRKIMVNCCLDHLKSEQTSMQIGELNQAGEVLVEPDIHKSLNAQEILSHVRKLPAATRTVFNLYIVDGYTHKEIAEMLRISEGTSKWHLSEARKILKLQLHQESQ